MRPRTRYTPEQLTKAEKMLRAATRAKPVTSEEIGVAVGIDDVEGNPGARGLIFEVMTQTKLPIVARSVGKQMGYFEAESYDDVKQYKANLQKRVMGTLERSARVDLYWHEKHGDDESGGQTSMEDDW